MCSRHRLLLLAAWLFLAQGYVQLHHQSVHMSRLARASDTGPGVSLPEPFAPHDRPSSSRPFFQGWYTRTSMPDGSSLAVVMGEQIPGASDPPTVCPPVMCTVIYQPSPAPSSSSQDPTKPSSRTTNSTDSKGSALYPPIQTYTRYFDTLSIHRARGGSSRVHHDGSSSSNAGGGSAHRGGTGDGDDARLWFSVSTAGSRSECSAGGNGAGEREGEDLTLAPSTSKTTASSSTSSTSSGEGEPGCEMVYEEGRVVIKAWIPGVLGLELTTLPSAKPDATPWAPGRGSPESWVGWLGQLTAVHYATLTLRTPVTFKLDLPPTQQQQRQQQLQQQPQQQHLLRQTLVGPFNPALDTNADLGQETQQEGVVHEGQDAAGVRSPVAAPSQRVQGVGAMHAESQWGRGFPQRWLWAEGQAWPSNSSSSDLGAKLEAGALGPTFVLAGGDLPHALSPPLPPVHTFLFSYRDPASGVSVAIDPLNPAIPGIGIEERVDACSGLLSLTLTTLTHVVQIDMAAPPDTFVLLPCPTERGFVPLSVESFVARAKLTIFKRQLVCSHAAADNNAPGMGHPRRAQSQQGNVEDPKSVGDSDSGNDNSGRMGGPVYGVGSRLFSQAAAVLRGSGCLKLLAEVEMQGVALEFGGAYMCSH